MNRRELERLDSELTGFLDGIVESMGRVERRRAIVWYVTGLLLDGERKSIEPMAARLVDSDHEVEAMRQRLQQAVSVSGWSEDEVFRRLAVKLESEFPGLEALVIDDTGFPKKGKHSVGVARQYSGTLGRTDNCQVAVSLHLACERGSGCIGMRLYLPEAWASDERRRASVGVPTDVAFKKKWELALERVDLALTWGVRRHVVLADAGYGNAREFRDGLTNRGLRYVLGVQDHHCIWPKGSRPPRRRSKHAKPGDPKPTSMKDLASRLSFRKVTWREGSRGVQSSRFAAARVRAADQGYPTGDEQWLLCEWPRDEDAPSKFYLATLPATASIRALVRLAKLRWRVERDYQELKQEIGLDHFEGRTWRGFHHHAALCATAHAFLALQRALFPPEDDAMDAA